MYEVFYCRISAAQKVGCAPVQLDNSIKNGSLTCMRQKNPDKNDAEM